MPENGWTEHEFDKIEKFASENKAHVLTIMYDDIVGSSTMAEQFGAVVFRELKENYNKTFIKIVTRNRHGDVIKTRGDGFMSVFTEPSSAVECALELQQVFDEHGKLRVRIGLDMGQVYKQGEGILRDLIGNHANWAARAEAMSDVGHILVTRSVYNDASSWIHKSLVSWKRHGLYRLKETEEALELFEPYNANLIKPLDKPRGIKAAYCIRCGCCVNEKDTFRCSVCGDSGICGKYCYDSHYQQCIKCRTETPSCVTSEKQKSEQLLNINKSQSHDFDAQMVDYKKSNLTNFIYSKLIVIGTHDSDISLNPYCELHDFTELAYQGNKMPKVDAVLWLPREEYIKSGVLQKYTACSAICTTDINLVKKRFEKYIDDTVKEILTIPPAKMRNEEREKLLLSMSYILRDLFLMVMTIPDITLRIGKNMPLLAYNIFIDTFLFPILEMHRCFGFEEFNLQIQSVGTNDSSLIKMAKKGMKAIYSKTKMSTLSFVKQDSDWETLGNMARMLAWIVGAKFNNDNEKWLTLFKRTISRIKEEKK